MPDVLQYSPPVKHGRRRLVKPIAAALSIAAFALPWALAIWAWTSVLHYDPSRDSFPMDVFAAQATWFASGVTLVIGLAWLIVWWRQRAPAK